MAYACFETGAHSSERRLPIELVDWFTSPMRLNCGVEFAKICIACLRAAPEEGKRIVFCTKTAEGGLLILGVRQRIYAKNVHLMVLG